MHFLFRGQGFSVCCWLAWSQNRAKHTVQHSRSFKLVCHLSQFLGWEPLCSGGTIVEEWGCGVVPVEVAIGMVCCRTSLSLLCIYSSPTDVTCSQPYIRCCVFLGDTPGPGSWDCWLPFHYSERVTSPSAHPDIQHSRWPTTLPFQFPT